MYIISPRITPHCPPNSGIWWPLLYLYIVDECRGSSLPILFFLNDKCHMNYIYYFCYTICSILFYAQSFTVVIKRQIKWDIESTLELTVPFNNQSRTSPPPPPPYTHLRAPPVSSAYLTVFHDSPILWVVCFYYITLSLGGYIHRNCLFP